MPAKEVNFRDYDGTIVYSYTPAEFAAQAYVAKYGRLEVGQMYATTDGKTHVLIHLEEGRTSPMLGCCPNGTVDVDWGDGTAHDTLTGTSVTTVQWTPTHNYAAPGDYDIKLTCTGTMGFYGNNSNNEYGGLLRYVNGPDGRNKVYQNAVQAVYCADSVTSIGQYTFNNCSGLSSITIPDSVTSIDNSVFNGCSGLSSVTIPDIVTSIGQYAFNTCYGLGELHFLPTSPPTVTNANTFSGIPTDCKIYVPTGSLSAYTSATNYPSSSTYTYIEE